METMKKGNLTIIYDGERWDPKKSKQKSALAAILAIAGFIFGTILFILFCSISNGIQINTIYEKIQQSLFAIVVFTMVAAIIIITGILHTKIYGGNDGLYELMDYLSDKKMNVEAGIFNGRIEIRCKNKGGEYHLYEKRILKLMKAETGKRELDGNDRNILIDISKEGIVDFVSF